MHLGGKNLVPGWLQLQSPFCQFLFVATVLGGLSLLLVVPDPSQMRRHNQQRTDHAYLMPVGDQQRPGDGPCGATAPR